MPELPEVETVARGLNRTVKGRRIKDVWTDWPKYFRLPKSEKTFKKCVVGRKITGAGRRAKYVLIELSGNYLLAIHQKMTGHLLYGRWSRLQGNRGSSTKSGQMDDGKSPRPTGWEKEKWLPQPFKGALTDPMNRFIRLIFFLDNKKMLAFSDVRRFGKVLCGPKDEVTKHLDGLGPEPLDPSFTFKKFKDLFANKRGRVKQVLMNPEFIAGIGNIYSDEILYVARVHPLSRAEKLKEPQLKAIYQATKKILTKAIKVRGTSIDDFRDVAGKKGGYSEIRLVYQRAGQKCPRGHIIKRLKIGGRSAHFCPVEQKLLHMI